MRQMKEERDNVVAENEELQDQLDHANSTASAGNMRINELMLKLFYVKSSMSFEI